MRIAYFSPLNPKPSGISDYSEELLPYLAHHAHIDLFIDDYEPSNREIVNSFSIFHHRDFERLARERRYDMCLYQMGNSPYHEYIYHQLLRHPGITVLHDYVLHHFLEFITVGRGDLIGYIREMGYSYGLEGMVRARRMFAGQERVPPYRYPLCERVVDSSLGIIVHSDYVARRLDEIRPGIRVTKVNQHLSLRKLPSVTDARSSLGLGDQFVMASFGRIDPVKRIDVILRAFARLRKKYPSAIYLLVGELVPPYQIGNRVRELGLDGAVKVTGYVDLDTFQAYMAACDVGINLRFPTAGETSASVIRLMGVGKPVIVSNVGWFAELPDDCCLKVDPGDTEEETLLGYMGFLVVNEGVRQELGATARAYIEENHSLESAAQGYVTFIREIVSNLA